MKKDNNSLEKLSINNDIILIHEDEDQSKNLSKIKTVKILATSNKKKDSKLFDNIIKLPTTLKEINETI